MNKKTLEYYVQYFNKQKGKQYPCTNQICGIITDDRNKALDFMKDKEFIEKQERYDQIYWKLSNGERWQWRKWSAGCRGCRFYKVVIDKDINDDIFNFLVLPSLASCCCSMEII